MESFNLIILILSFLSFPFFILVGWWFWKQKNTRIVSGFFIVLSILFFWMRFIEPQIIITRSQSVPLHTALRIAVISDIHLGLFKQEDFLEAVVKKVNATHADMLLIAGDFTFYPQKSDLPKLFSPLKNLTMPVYAVLGNHDTERPGEPLRKEMKEVLIQNNVRLLENEILRLKDITLIGMGDRWAGEQGEDDISLLSQVTPEENVLVLVHNPDSITDFPNSNADLTVSGHTHGGQIRIPLLYKKEIPTRGDFDKGLTIEKNTTLFITSGVGEVGLPMRFLNFPEVVVLEGV